MLKNRNLIFLLVGGLISIFIGCYTLKKNPDNQNISDGSFNKKDVTTDVNMDLKPVIYLYGYNNVDLEVNLNYDGDISCVYPSFDSGTRWKVKAQKNGTLIDTSKKAYNYLFYEGKPKKPFTKDDIDEGFSVKGSETKEFLISSLEKMGLNTKEIADFITFWLPRMQGNKYNVIKFVNTEYQNKSKITVTPKPDSEIRIFMIWYPSNEGATIPTQTLISKKRTKKTLVEWGGSVVGENINSSDDKVYEEMTIEELNKKRLELVAEDQKIQKIIADKQLSLSKVTTSQTNNTTNTAGSHPFIDSNGVKAVYTDAEWNKLLGYWAYTGHPNDFIKQQSVQTLNQLLAK